MSTKNQDKFFVGKVVEVISDNGSPTMELRVRIPTLHGNEQTGLKDSQLPIAKPLTLPGTVLDFTAFDTKILGSTIYVILEGGQSNYPLYFGLRGTATDYEEALSLIPWASEQVGGKVRVKKVGNTGYIYTTPYIPE